MTEFYNVVSVRMKSIIGYFLIHHEIDIIKLHVVQPLQSMKTNSTLPQHLREKQVKSS